MPKVRPATDPLSYHGATGQFYVTRAGKRTYLGADRTAAIEKYHRLALGLPEQVAPTPPASITAKELASRFLEVQRANWRNDAVTLQAYRNWLRRFLRDHRGLRAADLTVEMFAAWKLSLRRRGYAAVSINHYLKSVRAIYTFAEDEGLLERVPRLKRVKNEPMPSPMERPRILFTPQQIRRLIDAADLQLRVMVLLGLNCGFGPKDLQDLRWKHIAGQRVTLPRSKTGIAQTFLLWPETQAAIETLREERAKLIERLARRGRTRSDDGRVFMTKYWRPWNKDAVSQQFSKLCAKVGVPCHGFYRLRHGASTAMSVVAMPHVQRKFMRHSQLQQQVTYTHMPDDEVDAAILRAREKLLGGATECQENDPGQADVA
ncbi:MAG: tyrosine-type recombinase/integrase [Phycisphaerae bacterium]|nr:tyrosine-type recombinase/integrase [Phycisphaerae bacterium]